MAINNPHISYFWVSAYLKPETYGITKSIVKPYKGHGFSILEFPYGILPFGMG